MIFVSNQITEEDLGDGRVRLSYPARTTGWLAAVQWVLFVLVMPASCIGGIGAFGNGSHFWGVIAFAVGAGLLVLHEKALKTGRLGSIVVCNDLIEVNGERIALADMDLLSKFRLQITANVGGRVVVLANARNIDIADALYLRITKRTGFTNNVNV